MISRRTKVAWVLERPQFWFEIGTHADNSWHEHFCIKFVCNLFSWFDETLCNLDIWLKCNILSINIKKTNNIIFKSRQKKLGKSFSLSFGNQESEIKFLDVYVDERWTRIRHISFVCKQISKSVSIILMSRYYLSFDTKLTVNKTLIYPYITYCNSACLNTYVTNLNIIYYLQKRGVGATTNSDYREHTAPLFAKLDILDISKSMHCK